MAVNTMFKMGKPRLKKDPRVKTASDRTYKEIITVNYPEGPPKGKPNFFFVIVFVVVIILIAIYAYYAKS